MARTLFLVFVLNFFTLIFYNYAGGYSHDDGVPLGEGHRRLHPAHQSSGVDGPASGHGRQRPA